MHILNAAGVHLLNVNNKYWIIEETVDTRAKPNEVVVVSFGVD